MSYIVYLSENPTIFEPVGTNSSVYFDRSQQQIFTLRSRGTMGVTVKYPDAVDAFNFRIDDRGDVLSIKFSPENRILAIQRTQLSVDFLNFSTVGPEDHPEYSQACKTKNGKLLGFVWLNLSDILFITTEHLELHQVSPAKRTVRLAKHLSHATNWFLWHDASRVLVTSVGTSGNLFHVFHFRTAHTITKLSKFELPGRSNGGASIGPDNCFLISIYGHLYFVHMAELDADQEESGTNICLYKMKTDGSVKLSDILLVRPSGPLAINVVDNLILVHHQTEKVTYIYDIAVKSKQSTPSGTMHKPVIQPAQTIAPLSLASNTVPALSSNLGALVPVELYSSNWVINLPNTVIDGNLGCLWTIHLNNLAAAQLIQNPVSAVEFLLNRSGAKDILLDYCADLSTKASAEAACKASPGNLSNTSPCQFTAGGLSERLDQFASIFKRFGETFHQSTRSTHVSHGSSVPLQLVAAEGDEAISGASQPLFRRMSYYEGSFVEPYVRPYEIEQNEVSARIFLSGQRNENAHVRSFVYAVLVEFIRSLIEHDLTVDHSLQELLVSTIARLEDYTQLTYCIQSRFLSDSKPIALQLLSLESVYPAAGQLALDMLKRLNFSNEEVLEVLLLKSKPIEALRFCQMRPYLLRQDRSWVERILRVTLNSEDKQLFFSVFRFFELMDLQSKDNTPFLTDPVLAQFHRAFISMFGTSARLASVVQ